MRLFSHILFLAALMTAPLHAKQIELTWDQVEGANRYEIKIFKDGKEVLSQTLSALVNTWSGELGPGLYTYQIRGLDRMNQPGDFSEPSYFIVTPVPPSPAGSKVITVSPNSADVLLKWNGGDTDSFQVEVLQNGKKVFGEATEASEILVKALPAGRYTWRVSGVSKKALALQKKNQLSGDPQSPFSDDFPFEVKDTGKKEESSLKPVPGGKNKESPNKLAKAPAASPSPPPVKASVSPSPSPSPSPVPKTAKAEPSPKTKSQPEKPKEPPPKPNLEITQLPKPSNAWEYITGSNEAYLVDKKFAFDLGGGFRGYAYRIFSGSNAFNASVSGVAAMAGAQLRFALWPRISLVAHGDATFMNILNQSFQKKRYGGFLQQRLPVGKFALDLGAGIEFRDALIINPFLGRLTSYTMVGPSFYFGPSYFFSVRNRIGLGIRATIPSSIMKPTTFAYNSARPNTLVSAYLYGLHEFGAFGVSWKLLWDYEQTSVLPDGSDLNDDTFTYQLLGLVALHWAI